MFSQMKVTEQRQTKIPFDAALMSSHKTDGWIGSAELQKEGGCINEIPHWWLYFHFCDKRTSLCLLAFSCDSCLSPFPQIHSQKRSGRCPLACPPRWVRAATNVGTQYYTPQSVHGSPCFHVSRPLSHSIWQLEPLPGWLSGKISAIENIQLLQLCIWTAWVEKKKGGKKATRSPSHSFAACIYSVSYL